jgi:predicted lipoprotein with Yx(FWY)xxD motif
MHRTLQIAGCALGVLLTGACSSAGSSGPQKPAYGSPTAPASNVAVTAPGPARIGTAPSGTGLILSDAQGRAVYLFEADKSSTSTCLDKCAQEWPPLTTTGAPVGGTGVNTALLATSPRPDGALQVTYNGHPLYYYDDDHGPGTTAGQGETKYGAKWYLLTPAGLKIDDD